MPGRPADGAEQKGVGALARVECFRGKRRAARIERAAADQTLAQLDGVMPPIRDRTQNARAFGDDLRANSIAGEQGNR